MILYKPKILLMIVFLFLDCSGTVLAKNALIFIHSYSPDYEWTVEIDQGMEQAFQEQLGNAEGWVIKKIYLDGKTNQNRQIQNNILHAKSEILNLKPRGVILSDDLAFEHFFPFLKQHHIPLSFCGVNEKLKEYGYQEGEPGITGILGKYNIPALIKLMKLLRPTINNILFVGDPSITGRGHLRNFKEQVRADESLKKMGMSRYEEYYGGHFEDLKIRLRSVAPDTTGVIFANLGYVYTGANGTAVPYQEVDQWVRDNTDFIDAGLTFFHIKGGRLMALASSPKEIGYYSAKVLIDALLQGVNPNTFPLRQEQPLKLVLNEERAKKLGVQFPFEVLAYVDMNKILFQRKGNH